MTRTQRATVRQIAPQLLTIAIDATKIIVGVALVYVFAVLILSL